MPSSGKDNGDLLWVVAPLPRPVSLAVIVGWYRSAREFVPPPAVQLLVNPLQFVLSSD